MAGLLHVDAPDRWARQLRFGGQPYRRPWATESRLQALTTDSLLEDIEAETVDFADNRDGYGEAHGAASADSATAANGSAGIAVGMATNVPPTTSMN